MSDLPRHLEQANWHLLSLEGELASIVADHNDRNADATDTQNRLHAAYLEMQELQKTLHQAAQAMPEPERTRRRVGYVAEASFLQSTQYHDEFEPLVNATRTLRGIYEQLGGAPSHEPEDNVLEQAEQSQKRSNNIRWVLLIALLPLYGFYVGWQTQSYPSRTQEAITERLEPQCENNAVCLEKFKTHVASCLQLRPRWQVLLEHFGKHPEHKLNIEWFKVVTCINAKAGMRVFDVHLVELQTPPSEYITIHKDQPHRPELDWFQPTPSPKDTP